MANLTIRNLDDKVVERLKEHARQNERSLEAEIRFLLTREAEMMTREEFWNRAAEIRAMTPKGVKQTDSVELLREDRDR